MKIVHYLLSWLIKHASRKCYIYTLCDYKTKIRYYKCVYHRRRECSSQMLGLIYSRECAGQVHSNKQKVIERDGEEMANIMHPVD